MHPNAQRIADAYDAFSRGDLQSVLDTWTDDIVWHVRGSIEAVAGDKRGKIEITEFLGELMRATDGTFALEVDRVFADDECAVVIARQKGMAAGESIDSLVTHVYSLRDGKVCEGSFLVERELEVDPLLAKAFTRAAA